MDATTLQALFGRRVRSLRKLRDQTQEELAEATQLSAEYISRVERGLAANTYHNGHPDIIPAGKFPNDWVQYATEGIEVKGSRYESGWQGHNPEAVWLIVFSFDNNSSSAPLDPAIPFRFKGVYAAKLQYEDWNYSGRSETSRRTITASVNRHGMAKMRENWIYIDSGER